MSRERRTSFAKIAVSAGLGLLIGAIVGVGMTSWMMTRASKGGGLAAVLLGHEHLMSKNYVGAIEMFARGLVLRPSGYEPYEGFAQVSDDLGQPRIALEYYRLALDRMNPRDTMQRLAYARLLSKIGDKHLQDGRVTEATTAYQQGATLFPESPEFRHRIFLAYRKAGDFDRATEAAREYLRMETRVGHELERSTAESFLREHHAAPGK